MPVRLRSRARCDRSSGHREAHVDDDAGTESLETPLLFDAQPGPRAQLAAIVEVLSVLARSASSQEEVFDTVLNNARRLCGADVAQIHLLSGGALRLGRVAGVNEAYVEFSKSHPTPVDRESLVGRVTVDRSTQQITDVLADPAYRRRENQRSPASARSWVRPCSSATTSSACCRCGAPRWNPSTTRDRPGAGDVREPGRPRGPQRPCRPAAAAELPQGRAARGALGGREGDQLDRSTSSEVLATIVSHAVRAVGHRRRLADGVRPDDPAVPGPSRVRHERATPRRAAARADPRRRDLGRPVRAPRRRRSRSRTSTTRRPSTRTSRSCTPTGWRSLVAVPLRSPDRVVGAFVVRRRQPGVFNDETCDLLSAFASQSAVALTNARLYQELDRQSARAGHRQPAQVRVPREHVARAAHPAQRRHRVLGGAAGADVRRPQRAAGGLPPATSATPAGTCWPCSTTSSTCPRSRPARWSSSSRPSTRPRACQYALSLVRERAAQHRISLTLDLAARPRGRPRRRAAVQAGAAQPAQQRGQVHPTTAAR